MLEWVEHGIGEGEGRTYSIVRSAQPIRRASIPGTAAISLYLS